MKLSCPADINVVLKEEEKLFKYHGLAAEFQQMYGMPVHFCGARLYRCGVIQMSGRTQNFLQDCLETFKSGYYWNCLHLANN